MEQVTRWRDLVLILLLPLPVCERRRDGGREGLRLDEKDDGGRGGGKTKLGRSSPVILPAFSGTHEACLAAFRERTGERVTRTHPYPPRERMVRRGRLGGSTVGVIGVRASSIRKLPPTAFSKQAECTESLVVEHPDVCQETARLHSSNVYSGFEYANYKPVICPVAHHEKNATITMPASAIQKAHADHTSQRGQRVRRWQMGWREYSGEI